MTAFFRNKVVRSENATIKNNEGQSMLNSYAEVETTPHSLKEKKGKCNTFDGVDDGNVWRSEMLSQSAGEVTKKKLAAVSVHIKQTSFTCLWQKS
ncbi:hypothetical protein KIN20_031922 [Parelaphostrongylus tenuis]|uniref:Uncharacterized protein n=1 Tax=Parelaphostrongylus tenuis TaxID=148309 RepID=A0AAD5R651_PARTN|nr:hypothetical protein KIN20_031922 [Parelaphostrongylus tenuis]